MARCAVAVGSRVGTGARGGLESASYCWGDEAYPEGRQMANRWQGEFPWQNLVLDGYESTSPVGSFPANGYGLVDMAGNVWEWTTDWWQDRHRTVHGCCGPTVDRHDWRGLGGGRRGDRSQGHRGRLAPVRPELLPQISARRPSTTGH